MSIILMVQNTIYIVWTIFRNVKHLSHLVGKPTMWFPNRSDTNWAVQVQKVARNLRRRGIVLS